ncbi:MAG: hypothetical protein E8D41_01105 [Nitrospira sp.]|nr:MAG: hypothetical protein E8D41_01105 [Nitrospira sp.]
MRRLCGLNWEQVLLLNGSWLTMVGLAAGLSYQNGVTVGVVFLSMLGVLAAQWHVGNKEASSLRFNRSPIQKGSNWRPIAGLPRNVQEECGVSVRLSRSGYHSLICRVSKAVGFCCSNRGTSVRA